MMRFPFSWLASALALGILSGLASTRPAFGDDPSPLQLFDQRIMPIFRSSHPSSCVQCHLASVDLKKYILPSHKKTFVSLRDQGLIDIDSPEKSKILTLIQMGEKDVDRGARLIHESTRKAEYEAFAAWITACCADPELRDLPPLSPAERARPEKPDEVIRHARKSRVVDSFVRNVWSQRMRCFPCHTPHEIDPSNPRHQAAVKTRGEFQRKYGEPMMERLNIFRETPEATMQSLIEKSHRVADGELPLINLEHPRQSLLVLKPTSKLPAKREDGTFEPASSVLPVTHLGGLKMHPDDHSYKSFVAWLRDYSKVVGDRYSSVDELPADNWCATKLVLKVTSAPPEWPLGTPVQLFVHAWDEEHDAWSAEPIAFTQGTVTPRRMVSGGLFLLVSRDAAAPVEPENATLPPGDYLIKAHLDLKGQLSRDPTLLLGEEDFYGQGKLSRARWREGFQRAESISGSRLTKK